MGIPVVSRLMKHWRRDGKPNGGDSGSPTDESPLLQEESLGDTQEAFMKIYAPPPFYSVSPLQLWVLPLMKAIRARQIQKNPAALDALNLPSFSRDTQRLEQHTGLLKEGRVRSFLAQPDVRTPLLVSAVLELVSSLSLLAGPVLLRKLLQHASIAGLVTLVAVSLLASLAGRAKDQVCRTHAALIGAALKSAIFDKSLRLSFKSRTEFPASTVINTYSHDVAFFQNYFVKVHDLWSSILQLVIISLSIFWLLGNSCLIAFALMFVLFVSQSKANLLARASISGFLTNNDTRMKQIRDFLYNVKAVKVQCLQGRFEQKIQVSRAAQLGFLGTYLRLTFCFFSSMNQMIPALTATTAFVAYWWTSHALDVETVFPTLALFDLMYVPASKLSISVTRQFSVLPSMRRLLSLLATDEYAAQSFTLPPQAEENAAEMQDLEVQYPVPSPEDGDAEPLNETRPFRLGPCSLIIPKNKLTMIVGPVGSGKSTLLHVLAGYLPPTNPHALRKLPSVAVCTQEPWIQSATVRENIIFTSPWDEAKYWQVVKACCLEQDFASWPAGDQTVVGEKGTNVSGGQRARVSLARAVYSQAEVLLLDDPLAAVDAHVGSKLFRDCIRKLKQTVVLVTHQTAFLPKSDYILSLRDGKVVEAGPRADVLEPSQTPGFARSMVPAGIETNENVHHGSNGADDGTAKDKTSNANEADGSLHNKEERATGHVRAEVYNMYVQQAGGRMFLWSLAGVVALSLAIRVTNQYWFVWWLDDTFKLSSLWYMAGYTILTLAQGFSMVLLGILTVTGSLRASKKMHSSIIHNLLCATMAFFESQPIGRIINRLSTDLDHVDSDLMNAIDGLLNAGGQMTAATIMIVVSAPLVLVVVLPAVFVAYNFLTLYRVSARELRRLSAVLQSPVVTTLSESLGASATINAYSAKSHFRNLFANCLEPAVSAAIVKDSLDTWITLRAEMIAVVIVLSCGSLYVGGLLPPVQAGLALSTAITFTKNVYLLIWALIQVEVEMNSVERLGHYMTNIPQETDDPSTTPSASWPQHGNIEFQDVNLFYRAQPRPALDNITLHVRSGERVGLVGRTGSGKTTLVSTLSRLVEIARGAIKLDGLDIRTVPLERLRTAVHVLPQEPILFDGALRENLDPHGVHPDDELWRALELCGLAVHFQRLEGLETAIHFGGENLSAGQVQLVCMARALLQRPKVLVIDEATAAVDAESDRLIQTALQTQFQDTTILCIAHRIATLVWMDRIVVMDQGRILEEGSPRGLLLQGSGENGGGEGESRFRQLMATTGEAYVAEAIARAKP